MDTKTLPMPRAFRKFEFPAEYNLVRCVNDQPRSQGPPLYIEKVPWLGLVTCLLDFSRFSRDVIEGGSGKLKFVSTELTYWAQ